MDSRPFRNISLTLTWIFVFFLLSVCSGNDAPRIQMENTVFVALRGEDLSIMCKVSKPANQTRDPLTCFDPSHTNIYSCDVAATGDSPQTENLHLELRNMSVSGEYYCWYKSAKVFWFLRVRAEGYKDVLMFDYTEMIILAAFTALLVFSVVGSVYVFRGHWKGTKHESAEGKQKQNREERREKKRENESVDVITAQSTSFYASLGTRPGSIYDVLDHSAANTQPQKKKAKKKEAQNTVQKTPGKQNDGVFESVYENF